MFLTRLLVASSEVLFIKGYGIFTADTTKQDGRSHTEYTVKTTAIDLLVGSNYFWDVVGGDKIMLPSGIFMLPSKFSYIITGRYPENDLDN